MLSPSNDPGQLKALFWMISLTLTPGCSIESKNPAVFKIHGRAVDKIFLSFQFFIYLKE